MNELALFAGAGGGLLGSRLLGWRTICYVEKEPYCQKVIQARIRDGFLDDAPIWDDAKTFDGRPWAGRVDVVSAGFPCQPFSRAGKRLGENDERNLWPDTIRIIREVKPEWLLLENVSGLLCFDYFGRILADLAESGFDARWDCIPASAVGAPHKRDRLWVVSHASGERCETTIQHQHRRSTKAKSGGNGKVQYVADANGGGFEERAQFNGESKDNPADRHTFRGHVGGCSDQVSDADKHGCNEVEQCYGLSTESGEEIDSTSKRSRRGEWWSVEPPVGRVANGVPNRVAQLRAIGNAQVPTVVRAAWRLLGNSGGAGQK